MENITIGENVYSLYWTRELLLYKARIRGCSFESVYYEMAEMVYGLMFNKKTKDEIDWKDLKTNLLVTSEKWWKDNGILSLTK